MTEEQRIQIVAPLLATIHSLTVILSSDGSAKKRQELLAQDPVQLVSFAVHSTTVQEFWYDIATAWVEAGLQFAPQVKQIKNRDNN